MTRSLKQLHLAALIAVIVCVVIALVTGYLLLEDRLPSNVFPGTFDTPPEAGRSANLRHVWFAGLLAALGGIVCVCLWIHWSTAISVRHDIHMLVRMFKDVRRGSVRVAYPIMLTEFVKAHRYLRGWSEELLAEKQQLKGMGLIDHLSQLSNRRHFEVRLRELFDNRRTHGPSSVLIIDVDHFKHVNDGYGHDAGDALIVQFASLLRSNVRQTDVLARLGGDEFCIIYTYIPLHQASDSVDRLRRNLPRDVELKPGVNHGLCWTGGLSAFFDIDSKPDDVLWRADRALLRAKEAGRNRTMVYDPKNDTGHTVM